MLHSPWPILIVSVNRVTIVSGRAFWVIKVANDHRHLYTGFWQPLYADKQDILPRESPGQSQSFSFPKPQLSDREWLRL